MADSARPPLGGLGPDSIAEAPLRCKVGGMLAIGCEGPEVEQMRLREQPEPTLLPAEVLIEVAASALNRADLLQRRGLYPPPRGASEVLGLECAGRVVARGPEVASPAVGDRVVALLQGGGYAQRVAVDAALTLPAPAALSDALAAAVPEAFLTAQEALHSLGELRAGQWVLIHAAGGGVGSAAVQLAKLAGASVLATAGSAGKLELARSLGADLVVNYKEQDFAEIALEATEGRGVSLALDCVGASYAAQHTRCLAEQGRWVVLGFLGGRRATLDLARVLSRRLSILGLVMRTRSLADRRHIVAHFREHFLPALELGKLRPVVDRIYPFEAAQQAHRRMEANENTGKIVLQWGLDPLPAR